MTSSGTHRILIVDDEAVVVSLVRDTLEEENFEVFTASNGEQALKIISTETLDLLLTDIRMPGMDGIEMVRRARDIQPDVSVIFMTGYANLNSAKNAIKQGACDYIMKPFELSEIRQAVRSAIKAKEEVAEKTQAHELSKLADLNEMLFATNDRGSLVTSSLQYILMHLHVPRGCAIFFDRDTDSYTVVTIVGTTVSQESRPHGAVADALTQAGLDTLRYPGLVVGIADIPALCPEWAQPLQQFVVVPVCRSETWYGWFLLGQHEQVDQVKEADLKFLTVTASQLAITLENLALLEETQKAYAGLKELQDETVRLEKIATRGQMSAEIGHELNNFIGVVSGNLQLLDLHLRKGNHQDLGRYVAAMSSTIDKMKVFTSNLMDLAPIASEKSVVSFRKMVTDVIEYVRPQKRFQGVQIRFSAPEQEIEFDADTTQIQQLLYNLLNNAADAMASSGRKEIGLGITTNAVQGRFSVSITDTGCGFEPELLPKAFHERFTTKKLGHGFGLVVCKRIIENHGGTLRIESTPGAGTTIAIEFPLVQPSAVFA